LIDTHYCHIIDYFIIDAFILIIDDYYADTPLPLLPDYAIIDISPHYFDYIDIIIDDIIISFRRRHITPLRHYYAISLIFYYYFITPLLIILIIIDY
jgi:hypothetical protein